MVAAASAVAAASFVSFASVAAMAVMGMGASASSATPAAAPAAAPAVGRIQRGSPTAAEDRRGRHRSQELHGCQSPWTARSPRRAVRGQEGGLELRSKPWSRFIRLLCNC
ncbi:hypothetical protein B0T26DRAFT_513529 [Lasiosphaeria miniovina]|uniref:Secreted protein n=1 Tax=Lasiosphaeria miniovina TaxID=1954250 RepID=A0AA39ZUB8_9PEZI|nr:uncharacterized protein B0T26DRAFT_513529 [Lasiosphaeria miniovina]KAK0703798.1 hypothetical protein B0T26DRAFT_513529 [Lasiosphaeria miniovina]